MDDIIRRLDVLESGQAALHRGMAVLDREAVRSRRAATDALQADLVARLAPGSLGGAFGRRGASWDPLPALGAPLLQRLRDDASLSSAIPGRPEAGYPNLLPDPLLERLEQGVNLTTSYVDHGPHWEARYVLNSGTAPAVRTLAPNGSRGSSGQEYGFHSSVMGLLDIDMAAAADISIFIRASDGWTAWGAFLPSWLTGSAWLLAGSSLDITATAYVQIVDDSDTLLAESDPVEVVDLGDIAEATIAEVGLETPEEGVVYHWRLRVDLVATAPGGALIGFADPLLAYSDDGTPPTFTPAVGYSWIPKAATEKLVPIDLVETDIAASTTTRLSLTDEAMGDARTLPIPWGGSIAGISWRFSAAVSAGTYDLDVLVNGSAAWSSDGHSAQLGTDRTAGLVEFAQDDTIGVEVVTDGSFAPTTLELVVTVWLLVDYGT